MPATVTNVSELPLVGKGTGLDPNWIHRRRYFSATVDAPADDAADAVLAHASIPQDGDELDGTNLVVIRRTAAPELGDDSGLNWRVEVEYGVLVYALAVAGGGIPPWSRLDRISRRPQVYQKVMNVDFAGVPGVPIVNSVGDPFEGDLMMNQYNVVLSIRRARRQISFNPGLAELAIGTLNQQSINIRGTVYADETLLLLSVSTDDQVWTDGTLYYDINIEIEAQLQVPLKTVRVQNKGFRAYFVADVPDSDYLITRPTFNTDTGAADGPAALVQTPKFLRMDGRVFPDDALLTANPNEYEKVFVRYPTASWAAVLA